MTRVGLPFAVFFGACTPTPADVVTHLPIALETAHRGAAHATSPAALRVALAQAYTGAALTEQLRDRWQGRRNRGGTPIAVSDFVVEDIHVLAGSHTHARLEAAWRLAGTVLHEGHAHPRHLRAQVRWEAQWTPEGWRIVQEQPLEVLALP